MASTSSHRLRTFTIVIVVLVGLLVAADRVAVTVAERQTGKAIQSAQNLPDRPSVDIAGFPFLTQFARAEYGKVTLTAHDVVVGKGGRQATLSTLRTVLHHVDTSRNFHRIHARTLTASATISYTQLSRAIDTTVTYAGGGRIRATRSVTVLGQRVSATVATRPVVSGGAIGFTDTSVEQAGSLVASVSKTLTSLFDITVPLDDVPFDLRARSLTASSGGVQLSLDAADVTLDNS